MKNLFSIVSVLFLFLIGTTTSQAQFHMSVGPAMGFNLNLPSGSDVENGGSGFGIAFAGRIDMSFDQARMFGIITGLTFYDGRGVSDSQTGTDQQYGRYTIDNDFSLSYFQIEALFRLRLPAGIYFMMGPVIGFNESAEVEQTYQLLDLNQSGKSKQTLKETNVRFELKAGAGYDIPLSKLITLTPELSFGLGLTNVIKNVSSHVHTIQALVTCKFNVL